MEKIMKNKHIDEYSKEELKDEVLFLRLDQAGDHHYAEQDRKQWVCFQAHLLVNRIMTLQEIMKHNGNYNRNEKDQIKYLTAMVHDLYDEMMSLEAYIEGEDRESSIRAQMQRNGLTRAEAHRATVDWEDKQQGLEEDKSPEAINLRERIAEKQAAEEDPNKEQIELDFKNGKTLADILREKKKAAKKPFLFGHDGD